MNLKVLRAFLVVFAALAGGLQAGNHVAMSAYAAGQEPYAGLDTFARALTQIQEHYVEERSTEELVHAAILGMTDSLDAQSEYFDPETYAALRTDHEGTVVGIGVLVTAHPEGGALIGEVLDRSPALHAGLKAGDRVIAIDGEDVTGLAVAEIVAKVKGERGTPVRLTLIRQTEETVDLEVVRDEVRTPSVEGELAPGGLGYIRIEQFRRRAGDEFLEQIGELERARGGPLAGLVIDLRHNPGGLLEEAVTVVDHFVAEGLIVATRGRSGRGSDEEIRATAEGTDLTTPLAVLIDPRSASASEIVAGALQDHGRARVVGQPSYGKGSVQTYFEYEDASALKLTIAHYYLPSGRNLVRGEGIAPDELALPAAETLNPKLSLRERLHEAPIEDAERAELLELVEALPDPELTWVAPDFEGSVTERAATDPQLRAALRVLGG
ncbi:MAG: S41 family peptidase [Alphaproteobacteria bacterium]|nr:S41 family peptidase [Alphaproteobacteria bacterium]